MIDRFTRWLDAVPISAFDAQTVAHTFVAQWVSRSGVPNNAHHQSRCPVRVISTLGFAQATRNSSYSHHRLSPYHPRANGMIERFHRHLKGSLKATEQTCHWSEAIPLILLSIRTTVKTDLACSPAELVFGTALRIPGEFVHSSPPATDTPSYAQRLKATMQCLHPTPVAHHLAADQCSFVPKGLFTASHVFLRYDGVSKPLQHPYDGPYRVLKRSPKYFTLSIKDKPNKVSVDRIKPARMSDS